MLAVSCVEVHSCRQKPICKFLVLSITTVHKNPGSEVIPTCEQEGIPVAASCERKTVGNLDSSFLHFLVFTSSVCLPFHL